MLKSSLVDDQFLIEQDLNKGVDFTDLGSTFLHIWFGGSNVEPCQGGLKVVYF